MATTSTTGSTLLQPLSNAVQLPIDQVNFVVCQLFALLAAIWFRTYLHSSKTSSFIRHVVATLLGLYLALFCFGWYALHFLVQSGISYCIMIIIGVENTHNKCWRKVLLACTLLEFGTRLQSWSLTLATSSLGLIGFTMLVATVGNKEEAIFWSLSLFVKWKTILVKGITAISSWRGECPERWDEDDRYCFVFALGYLIVCQITRVYIFDYGQYSADFSGPMMIITQKITSLAYEIHDGMFRKDEELTPSQRDLAVRRMPSLLEYLSYNCNFMGILAGPLCSYKDYITFIEGRSYHVTQSGENGNEELHYERTEPSPNVAVIQKLLVCALSLLFHLTISNTLPVEYNIDEHFQATASWPTKVIYLYVSLLAARPKYYFAWTLADAINNAAGFGFRGYDRNGEARWDLISNLRIQQIEMSTSFKVFLDNWNIQTALWLKRVCYERASLSPTIQTFVLSAIWHGVYPGYYLTFLTGVVMTLAARAVRNNVRHYFLEPPQLKLLYDVITWIVTQIAISYTVVPFVLLSIKPSFMFYSSWYYCLHIVGILLLLLLPVKKTQRGKNTHENVQLSRSKKFDERENSLGQNSFPTTNNVCSQNQEVASRHSSLKQ